MTQRAFAVIGANYGDEGKGLVTDALASERTLVVRFNGGPQAGHTVETPDGHRHAFSHVGSGFFHGAPTLLARNFVLNPLVLASEIHELFSIGGQKAWVGADPRCLVTTPWDMLLNRTLEKKRGDARHGSCGLGLHETMVRSNCPEFTLTFELMTNEQSLHQILKAIQFEWIPRRLRDLELEPSEIGGVMTNAQFCGQWCKAAELARGLVRVDDSWLIRLAQRVVFEGAQGLGLDQTHGEFPWVTHSHTGLTNVRMLCEEAGIQRIDAYYVSRTYLTRHGAGPLPQESSGWWSEFVDSTNVENEWQGKLRFAPLDAGAVAARIRNDSHDDPNLEVDANLAVTCCDQCPPHLVEDITTGLVDQVQPQQLLLSYGPTRKTVAYRVPAFSEQHSLEG